MTSPTYVALFIATPNAQGVILQLQGSATKIVRIRRVSFTAFATTNAPNSLFTAGISTTASTASGTPLTVSPLDSSNPAPTATAIVFNSPAVATSIAVTYASRAQMGTNTVQADDIEWVPAPGAECPTLRNAGEYFDISTQLGTYAGVALLGVLEFTEE